MVQIETEKSPELVQASGVILRVSFFILFTRCGSLLGTYIVEIALETDSEVLRDVSFPVVSFRYLLFIH